GQCKPGTRQQSVSTADTSPAEPAAHSGAHIVLGGDEWAPPQRPNIRRRTCLADDTQDFGEAEEPDGQRHNADALVRFAHAEGESGVAADGVFTEHAQKETEG